MAVKEAHILSCLEVLTRQCRNVFGQICRKKIGIGKSMIVNHFIKNHHHHYNNIIIFEKDYSAADNRLIEELSFERGEDRKEKTKVEEKENRRN